MKYMDKLNKHNLHYTHVTCTEEIKTTQHEYTVHTRNDQFVNISSAQEISMK